MIVTPYPVCEGSLHQWAQNHCLQMKTGHLVFDGCLGLSTNPFCLYFPHLKLLCKTLHKRLFLRVYKQNNSRTKRRRESENIFVSFKIVRDKQESSRNGAEVIQQTEECMGRCREVKPTAWPAWLYGTLEAFIHRKQGSDSEGPGVIWSLVLSRTSRRRVKLSVSHQICLLERFSDWGRGPEGGR